MRPRRAAPRPGRLRREDAPGLGLVGSLPLSHRAQARSPAYRAGDPSHAEAAPPTPSLAAAVRFVVPLALVLSDRCATMSHRWP